MKNEKGSLLVETTIAIFLTLVFLAGTARLHASWKKRHRAILEHRNEAIDSLRSGKPNRVEKTEWMPAAGLPGFEHFGLP
jgi:hypothetical protein